MKLLAQCYYARLRGSEAGLRDGTWSLLLKDDLPTELRGRRVPASTVLSKHIFIVKAVKWKVGLGLSFGGALSFDGSGHR